MSGRYSRRKGYRTEAKIRDLVRRAGVHCKRVPLSGSAPGWAGDLILAGRSFEVKARANGFRQAYRWLEGHFGLVLSADRCEPLIVLRLGDFLKHCQFRDSSQATSEQDCGTSFSQTSKVITQADLIEFIAQKTSEQRSMSYEDLTKEFALSPEAACWHLLHLWRDHLIEADSARPLQFVFQLLPDENIMDLDFRLTPLGEEYLWRCLEKKRVYHE